MFDLVAFNPWLVFSNLILAIFMLWLISPAFDINQYIPKGRTFLTIFCLYVFCEFSFWGSDWFHLYDMYPRILDCSAPVENFYYWLAQNVSHNNYYLFRILIWGSALFLLLQTFKRTAVDYELTLATFIGVAMIWFSYGRVSLSMAISFFGLSLLFNPIHINRQRLAGTVFEKFANEDEVESIYSFRIVSIILGITFSFCAIFLHHSGIYATSIILLTIFSGFFTRRYIILVLILFVFIILAFPNIITSFLLSESIIDSQDISNAVSRSQQYMESTDQMKGVTYTLGLIIEKIPYYMLALSSFILWRDNIPSDIKACMRAVFLIVLSSTILYFLGGMNMQVIYDRFIKFAMIPATIILSYCLSTNTMIRWHRTALIIGIVSTLFQLSYMLYCSIIK